MLLTGQALTDRAITEPQPGQNRPKCRRALVVWFQVGRVGERYSLYRVYWSPEVLFSTTSLGDYDYRPMEPWSLDAGRVSRRLR